MILQRNSDLLSSFVYYNNQSFVSDIFGERREYRDLEREEVEWYAYDWLLISILFVRQIDSSGSIAAFMFKKNFF